MDDEPRFCATCGGELGTRAVEGRERRYCPACDRVWYRNPKPCAGVLVVDGEAVLLVKRTEPPGVGTWSVPAGYLEADEPPREAAVRELAEETGLAASAVVLHDATFVEHPDGRHVVVLVYVVPREQTAGEPVAGGDAGDARFWTVEGLEEAGEPVEPGYVEVVEGAVARVRR